MGRTNRLNFSAFRSLAIFSMFFTGTDHSVHVSDRNVVQIFLAPRVSEVCLGTSKLTMDLVLRNDGSSVQSVDMKTLDIHPSIVALVDTSNMKRRSEGLVMAFDRITPPRGSDIVRLGPGESVVRELNFPITNKIFSKIGLYKMMPAISVGDSNRPASVDTGIIFEIHECERSS